MRSRRALWLGAAALAAGGVVIGMLALHPPAAAEASLTDRPADAQPMVVEAVLGGDALVLVADRPGSQVQGWGTITAKLLHVDAPNGGLVSECYSGESRARLLELLPVGSVAWIATDETPLDEGGRYVVDVWGPDGRYVNYLMAVDGFVRASEMPPNETRWPIVSRAGASAASRFGGLWGDCGG